MREEVETASFCIVDNKIIPIFVGKRNDSTMKKLYRLTTVAAFSLALATVLLTGCKKDAPTAVTEFKTNDSITLIIGHHTYACYGIRDVIGHDAGDRGSL